MGSLGKLLWALTFPTGKVHSLILSLNQITSELQVCPDLDEEVESKLEKLKEDSPKDLFDNTQQKAKEKLDMVLYPKFCDYLRNDKYKALLQWWSHHEISLWRARTCLLLQSLRLVCVVTTKFCLPQCLELSSWFYGQVERKTKIVFTTNFSLYALPSLF